MTTKASKALAPGFLSLDRSATCASETEVSGPGWPPQFRFQREVRKC